MEETDIRAELEALADDDLNAVAGGGQFVPDVVHELLYGFGEKFAGDFKEFLVLGRCPACEREGVVPPPEIFANPKVFMDHFMKHLNKQQ